MSDTINSCLFNSPAGLLRIGETDGCIVACEFVGGKHTPEVTDLYFRRALGLGRRDCRTAILDDAVEQLDEYFAGTRRTFDLPLLVLGTTFQKTVWHALLSVPYGTTESYAALAAQAGYPAAVRAVANAVGANRLGIIIPCHRIVGSDGRLHGYAGGTSAKEYLLNLEKTSCI